jgi:hypothetical protein
MTGFDLSRIFRPRNNKNLDRIVYKYLTDKQLKEVRMYYLLISFISLVFFLFEFIFYIGTRKNNRTWSS